MALRLAWIAYADPSPYDGRFDDSLFFDHAARWLAAGKGYINFLGYQTAQWPPGYSLLLAAVYKVLGHDIMLAKLLNVLAGGAACVLIYLVAAKIFNRRVGLLAALLLALFPGSIYFSTLLMTESVFTAMVVLLILLFLMWALERKDVPFVRTFLLGVLFGAAALFRAEAPVLLLVVLFVWRLAVPSWRAFLRPAALLTAGAVLAVTPWTIRNAITMDKFIPISTGAGHTLLAGHQDDPYDSRSDFPEAHLREKYENLPFPERETKVEDEAMEEAIDFMFSHKRYEVRLVFEKLWHLYEDDDDALRWMRGPQAPLGAGWQVDNGEGSSRHIEYPVLYMSPSAEEWWSRLADGYYYAVMGAVILGLPLWFSLRDKEKFLLVMFVVGWTLAHLLFMPRPRYHAPLLPVFALWASVTLVAFWDLVAWVSGRRPILLESDRTTPWGAKSVMLQRIGRDLMSALVAAHGTADTPRVYHDRRWLVRELFWRSHEKMLSLSRNVPRRRVLDFGGGNGVLLPTLARMYDEVVCVDLNTDVAAEVVRLFGLTNVEVISGDLFQLSFPDGHFNTVVAASVLEHVEDLEPMAREIARVLAVDGDLLVNVPSENRFYGLGRRIFGYTKPADHHHAGGFAVHVVGAHLSLRDKKHFPFNWAPLSVFNLLRFVKERPLPSGEKAEADVTKGLLIVPAYNEEGSLRLVLSELRAIAPQFDVVVVNDGSTDSTPAIAREMGYPVLDLCFNVGIGGAMQTGFRYALEKGYRVALQVDSDGQFPPDQISKLAGLVLEQGWDMVIGSRFLGKTTYRGSRSRRIGNFILSRLCTLLSGQKITDCTSGFRAYSARALEYLLAYYSADYPEPEAIVFLARRGLRIREEPVNMRQRQAGSSSIGGLRPLYYMVKVSLALILNTFKEKPRPVDEGRGEE